MNTKHPCFNYNTIFYLSSFPFLIDDIVRLRNYTNQRSRRGWTIGNIFTPRSIDRFIHSFTNGHKYFSTMIRTRNERPTKNEKTCRWYTGVLKFTRLSVVLLWINLEKMIDRALFLWIGVSITIYADKCIDTHES